MDPSLTNPCLVDGLPEELNVGTRLAPNYHKQAIDQISLECDIGLAMVLPQEL